MNYKYLFGPVPSRRLGLSLGVDLVPLKTCSLDCVYCESGKTTNLTIDRKEYVPANEVITELNDYLSKNPALDFITFSGGGEPTLNKGIGKIVDFIKTKYPNEKIALLTNGTLFSSQELRREVSKIDLIIPSIDAASDNIFLAINRPEKNLDLEKILDGLLKLKEENTSEIWIEIFLINDLNDSDDEIKKIKTIIEKIKPHKVQLNSLDRPPTETWVKPVSTKRLEEISKIIGPICQQTCQYKKKSSEMEMAKSDILQILKRRPCTLDDLVNVTGMQKNSLKNHIDALISEETIVEDHQKRGIFYKIPSKP